MAVGKDVFLATSQWQDAVIRELEIIGEASKRVSDQLKKQYPTIPWKRISGLRDVLIHDYMGVDLEAVWEITQKNLLELKINIECILKSLP